MMAKKRKTLTPLQTKFVQHYAGNATEAIIAAGSKAKNPNHIGWQLMKMPEVLKAIREKQNAMAVESGKMLARKVTITRNDIINRLDRISESAESESARVAALGQLVTIFGLNPKNADTDLFAGWTDEELEYYRNSGGKIPPSRDGSTLGSGGSDEGSAVQTQR